MTFLQYCLCVFGITANIDPSCTCLFSYVCICCQLFTRLILFAVKKLTFYYPGRKRCSFFQDRSFSGSSGSVKAFKRSQ
jgi:hypothetical protein